MFKKGFNPFRREHPHKIETESFEQDTQERVHSTDREQIIAEIENIEAQMASDDPLLDRGFLSSKLDNLKEELEKLDRRS
jgi:hypothetical protein